MSQLRSALQQYASRKKEIRQRLSEFKGFRKTPKSWFFNANKLVLKDTDASTDQRLFEELCFCVLTANASAAMALRGVDIIREELMIASSDRLSHILKGKYRFPNVRAKYIIENREYLKKLNNLELDKLISSFKDPDELRDFFAKNIKGLGYKESSHFLRNIGFRGYCIIDKHILFFLKESKMIEKEEVPKNKEQYLLMERKMKDLAKKIKIDVDELDLLLWSHKSGALLK